MKSWLLCSSSSPGRRTSCSIKSTPKGGRIDLRAVRSTSTSTSRFGTQASGRCRRSAIFQEFGQIGTAAKNVEVTELGLTLSLNFLELNGGRIWMRSRLGTGSRFTFTVPMRQQD